MARHSNILNILSIQSFLGKNYDDLILTEMSQKIRWFFYISGADSCDQSPDINMEGNCTSFFSFGSSDHNDTYITVCDEVTKRWQIPLIITTAIIVIFLALSCGGIFILHKILDPFNLMEMSSSCFPVFYYDSVWPDNQKRIKGSILHFIHSQSK